MSEQRKDPPPGLGSGEGEGQGRRQRDFHDSTIAFDLDLMDNREPSMALQLKRHPGEWGLRRSSALSYT